LHLPGDKSITHRAVMLAALAEGASRIVGYLPSEDCLHTIAAFQKMGVAVSTETQGDLPVLHVAGVGRTGLSEPTDVIDCGNSGTTLRLLTGLLAGQSFFSALTGDASLRRRPMRRVVDPLRSMGAVISGREDGRLAPLAISGRKLSGIDYRLPIASAQVKSALLLAALSAEGTTRVAEPLSSRDHTERMFRHFGLPCEERDGWIEMRGDTSWEAKELAIPGDFSSAAFFIVAASIVKGSKIILISVGVNPTRTGLLDVLAAMGADVTIKPLDDLCGEPVAQITVQSSPLKGVTISPEQVPSLIDEFPILCIAAAFAEGETIISGAEELRVKESDRIVAMAEALRSVGVTVETRPDGLRIFGNGKVLGGACRTHGDHRVAMAMTIAALGAEEPITLDDTACIPTSFPNFMPLLTSLLEG
jgi:3-phosphoshikimate 1-carboxyvinyltransferase